MKIILSVVVVVVVIAAIVLIAWLNRGPADKEAGEIINRVVAVIEPLLKEKNTIEWNAESTGDKKYYDLLEIKEIEYRKILSDKDTFHKLKKLKERNYDDPLIGRQVVALYNEFLPNQIPAEINEELVKRETDLSEKFNKFRAKLGDEMITENIVREKLRESTDSGERRRYWEASKQVGGAVAADAIELIKLRNKAAKMLGFDSYYQMMLSTQDFDEKELFDILDGLAEFTKEPFLKLKDEIDTAYSKRYGVKKDQLRPWHYEDVFFQEAPQIYNVNLDKYFEDVDVIGVAKKYYDGMGLGVEKILAQSDLHPKDGKNQHAFCADIDRKGDIRILANVKNDSYWAGTMLHELGHAVYDEYISPELPFLLREPAGTFTTEGIAMIFGRLVYFPEWLNVALDEGDEFNQYKDGLWNTLRAFELVFSRWVLVMTNFERELYRNPDQNLSELWWNMVEKYQSIHGAYGRNEPDWAAKIHLALYPVYYHNYILGEMFASQITNYLYKDVTSGKFPFTGNDKLAPYMKAKIFAPGSSLKWNDLVKNATGEYLNPKYFADQFAK